MANSIKILELIKWYTDEEHPITQEKLRAKPDADKYMGYKTTFKRRLMDIANALNQEVTDEKNWRLVFPGYAHKKEPGNEQRHYTGPIYYRHEIKKHELDFILDQIQTTNKFTFEEKKSLADRLVKLLGNVYYEHSAFHNINETLIFSTYDEEILNNNLNFLRNAITKKKMIEFQTTYLDQNGNYIPTSWDYVMASPYRIAFYQGNYWLFCNKRTGTYTDNYGWQHIAYSQTYDVFRIDKMTNLRIAKESLEKKSHSFFGTPSYLEKLEKVLLYKEQEQINYHDITDNYGRVEFTIDWNSFPVIQRGDYSFIRDAFGTNYQIYQKEGATIVSVQATKGFFIDWALRYIDKIYILDTTDSAKAVKRKFKTVLKRGLENV